jgi:hypothetical protein
VNVHTIEIHPLRSIPPGTADKIDCVSAGSDATEYLPEMKLGAACLRVLVILPIEYEYPH